MTVRRIEDMFRPAFEQWATVGFLSGAFLAAVIRPPWWFLICMVNLVFALVRGRQAIALWSFWWRISGYQMQKLGPKEMDYHFELARKHKGFFVGFGYRWEKSHTQLADEVNSRNSSELRAPPDWILHPRPEIERLAPRVINAIRRAAFPSNFVPPNDGLVGEPWIHGLNPSEEPLYLPHDSMTSHTRFPGTTRAGKSVMLRLVAAQIIYLRHALIVFDPKNDSGFRASLEYHAKRAGRKFLVFDPTKPSESIRISPIASWTTMSEPATRISQNIDSDGSFLAFSWKTLYRLFRGLALAGIKPTIAKARLYLSREKQKDLLQSLLEKYFQEMDGEDWNKGMRSASVKSSGDPIEAWIDRFNRDARTASESDLVQAIGALIEMYAHEEGHYSKMVQTLEPILDMLGTGELGRMMSPDLTDLNDKREIWTAKSIIEEGAILYIASNSLADSTIGMALCSMFAADLASLAGDIQNSGRAGQKEIYIAMDEAAEGINAQMIQLLNKGGGAGFRLILCYQTDADFAVKLKSAEMAEMALGNLNNTIVFRMISIPTAEAISKLFGFTKILTQSRGISTGSQSAASFTDFRGQISRSESSEKVERVPVDLLTRLGPGQYFGFWAGRTLVKGRAVLLNEIPENQDNFIAPKPLWRQAFDMVRKAA